MALLYLGQNIEFDGKTVKYVSKSPFWQASKMLGWSGNSAGIGINVKIIWFCLNHQSDLEVFIQSENTNWFIPYHLLKLFIEQNSCDWYVKGQKLKVIAWDQFKPI